MRSSEVTPPSPHDREFSISRESLEREAEQSDAKAVATFECRIRTQQSALRRRFRQHAAIALILGLAALTLVLIVRVNP